MFSVFVEVGDPRDHVCVRVGNQARVTGKTVERAWRPLWKESTVDASEHPLVHELVPTVPQADLRQSDVFIRGMSIANFPRCLRSQEK